MGTDLSYLSFGLLILLTISLRTHWLIMFGGCAKLLLSTLNRKS